MSSIDAYNSLMTTFTSLEGNLTIHNASISAENAKVAACDRICAPAADEGVRRMLCLVCGRVLPPRRFVAHTSRVPKSCAVEGSVRRGAQRVARS